jgi:hypothetical protein
MRMDIQYIKRADIDKVKWNSCVHYATNGNIFGYIWYLDHIAKDWDALVEGDYESVFPLIWREDFLKRKELYQPELIRESGIYSIHVLSPLRISNFLNAIPEAFKKMRIHLNEQNRPPEAAGFKTKTLTNYQLFLNRPYEDLADGYSRTLLEQLQKAEDEGLVLTSSIKPEKIADFYKNYLNGNERVFHGLQRVMYNVLHRGWGFASSVLDTNAEVLAVNFFIYSHKKVLSLIPVSSPKGKKVGALPYLMNGIIRSHANKPIILDFNQHGEDQMAERFGARANNYYKLERNNLLMGIF